MLAGHDRLATGTRATLRWQLQITFSKAPTARNYNRRLRIRYSTPSKKMTIDILLMPCIILILILEGREGSLRRKKYPPTSPSEKNSFQPCFF